MFIVKKKYFLLIESIKDINLSNIKKKHKFVIIYRPGTNKEKICDIKSFRNSCRQKKIEFYIANNIKLCILLQSDGIYLSSYNRTYRPLNFKNYNFKIIVSAHNLNEIRLKIKQGCDYIIFSKLFLVDYNKNSLYLGINRFNNFLNNIYKKLIPLGGIKINNINKLKNLNSEGFALMSEIKKKPAILDRLF